MDLEQLMGRYFRLKQELSIAYRAQPWHGGKIDRLADDLAATEREIAALQPLDEQAQDALLDFVTTRPLGSLTDSGVRAVPAA